jgi:hypothetical protein
MEGYRSVNCNGCIADRRSSRPFARSRAIAVFARYHVHSATSIPLRKTGTLECALLREADASLTDCASRPS